VHAVVIALIRQLNAEWPASRHLSPSSRLPRICVGLTLRDAGYANPMAFMFIALFIAVALVWAITRIVQTPPPPPER
jgi:hypothetical protein